MAIKDGLKALNNLPWYILMVLVVIVNLSFTIKNQSTIYYMQYNLNRPDLTPTLLTVPNLFLIATIVFSPMISKRMGKRNASMLGIGVSILGSVLVLVSNTNIVLLFTGTIITFTGLGIPTGLLGAMFADTVDYVEWKSRVRSTGLIYSASSIGIKMGQGLGGAMGAGILALGHYVPNVIQTISSLTAIEFNFAWIILIGLVILEFLLYFYKVDQVYPRIEEDLKNRRLSLSAINDPALKS